MQAYRNVNNVYAMYATRIKRCTGPKVPDVVFFYVFTLPYMSLTFNLLFWLLCNESLNDRNFVLSLMSESNVKALNANASK